MRGGQVGAGSTLDSRRQQPAEIAGRQAASSFPQEVGQQLEPVRDFRRVSCSSVTSLAALGWSTPHSPCELELMQTVQIAKFKGGWILFPGAPKLHSDPK